VFGFGLVTWDLPGHGHSPGVAPGRLSLGFCADSLARVVDETSDGKVILVGHSLGGVITLAYLAGHPETAAERVRGAVLVSTPMTDLARAVAGRWPGGGLRSKVVGRAGHVALQSDLAERVLGRDVGRRDPSLSYRMVRWGFGREPSLSQVLFVRDAIASVRPDVRAETYQVMSDADVEGLLTEVRVPTLVVYGGRDRLVSQDESRSMARALRRGRAVAFPGAGHAVFLEDHERFTAELRRFAARRLADGA
jgi:pimeloyl-ACP methyl ester carboxylesterase